MSITLPDNQLIVFIDLNLTEYPRQLFDIYILFEQNLVVLYIMLQVI